jgi:predicted acyl esterase
MICKKPLHLVSNTFLIILYILINVSITYCQKNSDLEYSVQRTDFTFTTNDGVNLDCTKFEPFSARSMSFPAIIFCNGFGGSKNDVMGYAEYESKYGYYTLAYSMRGQGNSTGYSNLMSRTEMLDLMQLIAFVKSETLVNPDRIGLVGSSQGGIISFMAACYGADVRCVVSDLTSPEFASSWIENGCIKTSLLWSLSYDSSKVRYNERVTDFRRWILSAKKDKWDSLAYYLPKERDFIDKVNEAQVPLLISDSWQDKFFSPLGILKCKYNFESIHKIYLGAVEGHGSDTAYEENLYHSEIIEKWIEYWLYDVQNSVIDSNRMTYAVSCDPVNYSQWSYQRFDSPGWPPEGVAETRLYFYPEKKLKSEKNNFSPDTVSILNDVKDNAVSMQEAINEKFTGDVFASKFQKNYIYLETDPLEKDYIMLGTPRIYFYYSSDADICQYNFQIWEVYPDDHMNFITRANYTDRKYYPGRIKEKWLYGIPAAHVFKKGDRIRLYITNIDNGPSDRFLGTNPFVLPVLKRSRNTIYLGGSKQSFIELPLK